MPESKLVYKALDLSPCEPVAGDIEYSSRVDASLNELLYLSLEVEALAGSSNSPKKDN